jgi:ribosomal protein L32
VQKPLPEQSVLEHVCSTENVPFALQQAYNEKVKDKVFALENPLKESAAKQRRRQRRTSTKPVALTAREKRSLGVHKLPQEGCR